VTPTISTSNSPSPTVTPSVSVSNTPSPTPSASSAAAATDFVETIVFTPTDSVGSAIVHSAVSMGAGTFSGMGSWTRSNGHQATGWHLVTDGNDLTDVDEYTDLLGDNFPDNDSQNSIPDYYDQTPDQGLGLYNFWPVDSSDAYSSCPAYDSTRGPAIRVTFGEEGEFGPETEINLANGMELRFRVKWLF